MFTMPSVGHWLILRCCLPQISMIKRWKMNWLVESSIQSHNIYIIYIMVFDPAWDDDDPQLAPPLNLEPRCYTSCSTPRRTAPTHPRALWVTTGGTQLDRASAPTYLLDLLDVLISFYDIFSGDFPWNRIGIEATLNHPKWRRLNQEDTPTHCYTIWCWRSKFCDSPVSNPLSLSYGEVN